MMLKKHAKPTGQTQLQLGSYYKKADFLKSKREKELIRQKSQDSQRVYIEQPQILQLFEKLMRLETKIKCCYKCEDFVSGAISRDLGFLDNEMISLPFNVD